jgi:hypothetical protein
VAALQGKAERSVEAAMALLRFERDDTLQRLAEAEKRRESSKETLAVAMAQLVEEEEERRIDAATMGQLRLVRGDARRARDRAEQELEGLRDSTLSKFCCLTLFLFYFWSLTTSYDVGPVGLL